MPIKFTEIKPVAAPSLFWQRLAGFLAVAVVILLAVWLFGADQPVIQNLALSILPALVSGFVGKRYFEPVAAVTQKALTSMAPEKANLIIENSLQNMQPDIAAAIRERVSHPPQAKVEHGEET